MPKGPYIKNGDREFSNQMLMFKGAIGAYASLLGVSAAQVTAQAADAATFPRRAREVDVQSGLSRGRSARGPVE
jgi:hypothetical protein